MPETLETTAAADGGENGLGVIVVDDQAVFRAALRQLVSSTPGMAVVSECCSGEAALEAVEQLSPALVIMDVRMPGMGGVEATRQLTARHPRLPVFLVSADAGDPDLLRESGAAVFARKQELSPRWLRAAWETHGS